MGAAERAGTRQLALALILLGLAGMFVHAQSGSVTPALPQVPPPAAQAPAPRPAAPSPDGSPPECVSALKVFPGAQFLASYDAGRNQRYCLYGTTASFAEVVAYYKVLLKQKGEQVFDDPAIYAFDVGRFREDTMAFPPGVTVKDYSGAGQKG
jgi:hypothetical protein